MALIIHDSLNKMFKVITCCLAAGSLRLFILFNAFLYDFNDSI